MIEKTIHKKLMGTAFSLGISANDESLANHWLSQGINEIERIETLLSEYKTTSQTSYINDSLHLINIVISKELFQLIQRSNDIAKLTNGCFDITTGVLKNMYEFRNREINFPNEKKIIDALSSVGYKKLQLNSDDYSIKKLAPNMKISFNAIGKGYAADAVGQLWQANGVTSGFINASGDLCAFGKKADDSPWNVAIANPEDRTKPLFYIPLYNQAIATSGDYEQYFIYQGKKYSHNINPHTGKPLEGIKSVSIISPSAELSDALATAIYVMGQKKGINFINQLPNTHAIIINENNQIIFSKNLNYENIQSN